jgi:hypothetical protein
MPQINIPIGPGGPVFDFLIGVSQPRANALVAVGQPDGEVILL